jgi:hypothetical protein
VSILISDFKPLHRATLRGFFNAAMPSDLVLHEVALHHRDGTWWVQPASKPMLSRDGTVLRDDAGKIRYSPIVSFRTKQARDRFNRAVLEALRATHPEAFAEDGTMSDDKLRARGPIPDLTNDTDFEDEADAETEESLSEATAGVFDADRSEIGRFVTALFPYADGHTYASLRAFHQFRRDVPPELIMPVAIDGDLTALIDAAFKAANRCARADHPVVFAPPVCTFTNPNHARTSDLANGLTLSVELDEGDTGAARGRLEGLLGPATVIVASGGAWSDPDTGEVHAKLHLHWRLSEPTRSEPDHQQLLQARNLAAQLVGADPTGKPIVHPLRWPGSWNTKDPARPRMARIVACNETAQIHLPIALDALSNAAELAGWASADLPHSSEPQAPLWMLESAMPAVANPDLHYGDWVARRYACWHATGGTAQGFDLFDAFSQKSAKYDANNTETTWKAIDKACRGGNPPITAGAGTIFFHARLGGWKRPPVTDDPGYAASLAAEAAERGSPPRGIDNEAEPGDWTHLWRSQRGDYWVTPLGEPEPGRDGRQYVHVRYQGGGKQADSTPFPDGKSYVPFDELLSRAEWEVEAQERAIRTPSPGTQQRSDEPPPSDPDLSPPDEEQPPPRDEHDDFVLPLEFSENRLAYLFSEQHADRLVYVHGWGKWMRYDAGHWREDHAVSVFDEARRICAREGERARFTLPSRFADKVASAINKASCVAAIERLARHHAPQVRHVDVFDADKLLLNGLRQNHQLSGD